MTIPASQFVDVTPSVINAGGDALDLNGLMLTSNAELPLGVVQSFPTAAAVSSYFGPTSTEAQLAAVYFNGWNGATATPGALLMANYPTAAVPAWIRGAPITSLTALQALSGTLTLDFNGTSLTSSSITLTSATSFSDAASIIEAAFTSPGFSVSYDPIQQGFLFTSTLTGATATIVYATGTLAAGLNLTEATGAVLSQGSAAATPVAFMDSIIAQTQNWATFMTLFEPVTDDKLSFSEWTNNQKNRYAYVGWDTDITITEGAPATSSWMYLVNQANYSGSFGVYKDPNHAAFVLGVTASLDFNATNGRASYGYKYQSGLTASVTDPTTAANVQANGYNYIGSVATANQGFTFLYPGQISGPFGNMTRYVNQIYLNSQLQLAALELLTQVNSIPYNTQGYAMIAAAFMDPINEALNFGSIRPGVPLSSAQATEVNNAAGVAIDQTLSSRGWYLQILPASAQVRAAGGSPPCNLWYMDGGDVLKISLASILVE